MQLIMQDILLLISQLIKMATLQIGTISTVMVQVAVPLIREAILILQVRCREIHQTLIIQREAIILREQNFTLN